MFEWVRNNKRVIQVLLALIALPFAFFGIESYQALNASTEVATVGDQQITEQEFTNALRQQQERLRGILGRSVDASMLDTPEMRKELLENLISQRLLTQRAVRDRLAVTDERLQQVIGTMPAFQIDGKFSHAQYEALLRAQNMTPGMFENSMRHDLMMQQLGAALSDASIVPLQVAQRLAQLRAQQREVAEVQLKATQYAAQVKPTAEALQAFYDANKGRFQSPEQVRVEFVVLNGEALAAAEPIPEAELRKVYEANQARYGQPEQRQASHILVGFKQGVDKAQAKQKAEQLLAQIRKSPASFAELAKKNSDDPGSGAKGGDLGYFGRGMMVKAFEEAAFALKQGELAGPVESEFGYHIIKLTGIRPGQMKPFEQVRGEIEAELKKQRSGRRFAEAADGFSDIVYEQSDSLKPAAEKFKLSVRQTGWMTRSNAADPLLNNPRLLAALFSDDVLKNHRNTEAVEVAPGTLVAARVTEHKPAAQKSLDEVRAEVVAQYTEKEARDLARKDGAAKLEQLRKGEAGAVNFPAARLIARDKPEGVRPEALDRVFRANTEKLPAYTGLDLPDGYGLYRIGKVVTPPADEKQTKAIQEELARLTGNQEFQAYIAALRSNSKVNINQELLLKKQ